MLLARHYSVDEAETEEHRAFWKHLLRLFEEAIVRIDAKSGVPFTQPCMSDHSARIP
jgi:hypothetical protein